MTAHSSSSSKEFVIIQNTLFIRFSVFALFIMVLIFSFLFSSRPIFHGDFIGTLIFIILFQAYFWLLRIEINKTDSSITFYKFFKKEIYSFSDIAHLQVQEVFFHWWKIDIDTYLEVRLKNNSIFLYPLPHQFKGVMATKTHFRNIFSPDFGDKLDISQKTVLEYDLRNFTKILRYKMVKWFFIDIGKS